MGMYSHEIVHTVPSPVMRHWRQELLPSGDIVITELAATMAVVEDSQLILANSLLMPNAPQVAQTELERIDAHQRAKSQNHPVEWSELQEFVESGAERWQMLLKGLGTTSGIQVQFNHEMVDAEISRPSGLVVPQFGHPKLNAYTATRPEVEALKSMVMRVEMPSTEPDNSMSSFSTGFYL